MKLNFKYRNGGMGDGLIFCFVLAILLMSCNREDVYIGRESAFITYMIAENSLSGSAIDDINEMERKVSTCKGGAIFIYADFDYKVNSRHPAILKIVQDDTDEIKSEVLKEYPEQNSCDPAVMKTVLEDIYELAGKRYQINGLVLWSHGLGWLPPSDYQLKSFGEDAGYKGSGYYKQMEIKDLAGVLSDWHYNWIIFDACLMGSIEVAYELKDVCDYIIASPTEISKQGMPYEKILDECCSKNTDVDLIARKFFDYYKGKNTWKHSISVVRTGYLDVLADFFRERLTKEISGISIDVTGKLYYKDLLQKMDESDTERFFDLKQFVQLVCEDSGKLYLYDEFNDIMDYLIAYSNYSNNRGLLKCGGLNTYIIQEGKHDYNAYYKTLSWYSKTNLNSLYN